MKRTVLLSAVMSTVLVAFGQQTKTQNHHLSKSVEMSKSQFEAIETPSQPLKPGGAATKSNTAHGKYRSEVYDFVKVGNTFYDLQTNASIGRRTILHDDGTITVGWTYSGSESTTWPDRGSGVNYYDGSNWGSSPSVRTENLRTGWPSIGMLRDGSIYTIAHDAADGGLLMTRNTGKGTAFTSDAKKVFEHPQGNMIWNRTANLGDTMFAVCNFSAQEDDEDVFVDGVENPTMYSRSLDGGKTWDALSLLPGYDSNRYASGGGDTYAIDARDSIVVIAIGGSYKDLSYWKSTDYGDSWTKSVADSFMFGAFEFGSELIDQANRAESNDGAIDVLIDNDGTIHLVSGRLAYWDDDTTNNTASVSSFFHLYHWSENEPEWKICGNLINMDESTDANGNPTYDITSETTNSMGTDGNPANGLAYAARYGGTSISTHPSLSVDEDNNIYVTWDAPIELTFNDYLANYRDVLISYSTDNGANWALSQNATQVRSRECVFACLTKRTDDFVHFIFQMDEHPGTNLQNSGSGNLHPNVENTIYYAAIPVQDLMDRKLGINDLSVSPIEKESKVFVVSQNQPNPFSEETNVVIYLRAGSEMSYTVTDAMGKIIEKVDLGYKNPGNHEISIKGDNLSSGVYFYTLTTKDSEITKKMQVLK
ncbi:MAG: T9SS type A sorting domain-containing protein [Bacteroidia bacterium]|nr:T9SS type A sorting domain-containing protein [Bacteroidia bacterium]